MTELLHNTSSPWRKPCARPGRRKNKRKFFVDTGAHRIQTVSIRIIRESFLQAAAARHPRAADALQRWTEIVLAAAWRNPVEMKQAVTTADPVKVRSGKTVYVFNIRRNEFRLIAAFHFDRQRAFTLRFMTHAEYDLNLWKIEL